MSIDRKRRGIKLTLKADISKASPFTVFLAAEKASVRLPLSKYAAGKTKVLVKAPDKNGKAIAEESHICQV